MSIDNEKFLPTQETVDNMSFGMGFVRRVNSLLADKKRVDVLDYGAYTKAQVSPFRVFPKGGGRLVAYNPAMPDSVTGMHEDNSWVKIEPDPQPFDLVIFNFSLHHIDQKPDEILKSVQNKFNPSLIAVSEYDFTNPKLTSSDFDDQFVTDLEKEELKEGFNGDRQVCFEFHRKLGSADIKKTFDTAGFTVAAEGNGEGAAKNKYFLIGARNGLITNSKSTF